MNEDSGTQLQKRPHLVPCLVAAGMLVGCLGKWPYGYYTLLRWVVCGVACFTAWQAFEWKRIGWVWLAGFVALLFNPLIPVHLSREIWVPVDLLVAVFFIVAVVVLKAPPELEKTC